MHIEFLKQRERRKKKKKKKPEKKVESKQYVYTIVRKKPNEFGWDFFFNNNVA